MIPKGKRYVLVTPARNEETFIEKSIHSVLGQRILPKKWVIVNDGSTDRTGEVVHKYTINYEFIQLVCVDSGTERNFHSKVKAFNAGYAQVKNNPYDFIGNLDADVSFEPDFFERILKSFENNPILGIAGGWVYELENGRYKKRFGNTTRTVAGAIQLFRRECFEEIGGYVPLPGGGIDHLAVLMARKRGWEVRSFPEMKVRHHRKTGTEGRTSYSARFLRGREDYLMGHHPLYGIAKCISRVVERPFFLGSVLWLAGYYWASIRRMKRPISDEMVKYIRTEQMDRLRSLSSRKRADDRS